MTMTPIPRTAVRAYLEKRLSLRNDRRPLADFDSLFKSGRLDSVDAVETIVYLEKEFGVDFSDMNFDQALIDSIDAIVALRER